MRFAIIGTGSIGGYIATKVAEAGEEVAVLARGAHLAAIRERGLTLRHQGDERTVRPAIASDNGAELGVADVAVFAVKGQGLATAIEAASPGCGAQDPGAAVPLNGVEAPSQAAVTALLVPWRDGGGS